MPFEYEGRDAVAEFCSRIFAADRRFDLVPTRANGQPAYGVYLRAPDGTSHGIGLFVLTLSGDRISAMTRFESSVLPWFALPPRPMRCPRPAALSTRLCDLPPRRTLIPSMNATTSRGPSAPTQPLSGAFVRRSG